ncbi:hypothetical protein BC629DRAFT_1438901 [Irpex lacteus]|nr:hypothetical protein BC629DRAFT_1438901 [Irpex lacteus]
MSTIPDTKDSQPIQFHKPFDEEDADLIIRFSDTVHFRVHKLILGKASSVFAGMFTLPSAEASDTIQTVELEEDGATVLGFLHLCYPIGNPGARDRQSGRTHALAEKLGRTELMMFIDTDPLRTYVLACRANAREVARRAAYGCLTLPLEKMITSKMSEVGHLSTSSYSNLLVYYCSCRQAAVAAFTGRRFAWMRSEFEYCWFSSSHDRDDCPTSSDACYAYCYDNVLPWSTVQPRRWWYNMTSTIEMYLEYKAPPLSPRLTKNIRLPKRAEIQCEYCRTHFESDWYRFAVHLEEDMAKRVKTHTHLIQTSLDVLSTGKVESKKDIEEGVSHI